MLILFWHYQTKAMISVVKWGEVSAVIPHQCCHMLFVLACLPIYIYLLCLLAYCLCITVVISMRSKHITEINIAFPCLMAWIYSVHWRACQKSSLWRWSSEHRDGREEHIFLIGDVWKDSFNYHVLKLTLKMKLSCSFSFTSNLTPLNAKVAADIDDTRDNRIITS